MADFAESIRSECDLILAGIMGFGSTHERGQKLVADKMKKLAEREIKIQQLVASHQSWERKDAEQDLDEKEMKNEKI